eukprot:594797-Rhodomonas_salina.1
MLAHRSRSTDPRTCFFSSFAILNSSARTSRPIPLPFRCIFPVLSPLSASACGRTAGSTKCDWRCMLSRAWNAVRSPGFNFPFSACASASAVDANAPCAHIDRQIDSCDTPSRARPAIARQLLFSRAQTVRLRQGSGEDAAGTVRGGLSPSQGQAVPVQVEALAVAQGGSDLESAGREAGPEGA